MQPDGTTLLALKQTAGGRAENSFRSDRLPVVVIASALTGSAIRNYIVSPPIRAIDNCAMRFGRL